jgi:hypothetical protein
VKGRKVGRSEGRKVERSKGVKGRKVGRSEGRKAGSAESKKKKGENRQRWRRNERGTGINREKGTGRAQGRDERRDAPPGVELAVFHSTPRSCVVEHWVLWRSGSEGGEGKKEVGVGRKERKK